MKLSKWWSGLSLEKQLIYPGILVVLLVLLAAGVGIYKMEKKHQAVLASAKYGVGQEVVTRNAQGSLRGQITRVFRSPDDTVSYDFAIYSSRYNIVVEEVDISETYAEKLMREEAAMKELLDRLEEEDED